MIIIAVYLKDACVIHGATENNKPCITYTYIRMYMYTYDRNDIGLMFIKFNTECRSIEKRHGV